MFIGKNIKAVRKIQGMTQDDLAVESGISRSYIADLERDRYNPSVEKLVKIAQALKTETGRLLDGVLPEKAEAANGELFAFDRWEFRGLLPDEIESLAGVAAMFKKSRRGQ